MRSGRICGKQPSALGAPLDCGSGQFGAQSLTHTRWCHRHAQAHAGQFVGGKPPSLLYTSLLTSSVNRESCPSGSNELLYWTRGFPRIHSLCFSQCASTEHFYKCGFVPSWNGRLSIEFPTRCPPARNCASPRRSPSCSCRPFFLTPLGIPLVLVSSGLLASFPIDVALVAHSGSGGSPSG